MMTYEVGATHHQRTELGDRVVAGIDYQAACQLWEMSTTRHGLVSSENGALDLEPAPRIDLGLAGAARLLSHGVAGYCLDAINGVVSNPEDWDWAKVNMSGEDIAGISCLGILREVRGEDDMVIRPGEAIVIAL